MLENDSAIESNNHTVLTTPVLKEPILCDCPKCSANPITVTPIWKWQFENKERPILFKFPFSHKRFQMGQKIYSYQLYKL